jgi:hypothetical protein
MIMQQNEIERSRFNYTIAANERSTSANRRRRTKSTVTNKDDSHTDIIPDPPEQPSVEPFKFNVPSVPPPPSVPVPPQPTTTTTTTNRKATPPPSLSSVPAPASSIANLSNKTEYAQSSNPVTTKSTNQLPSTTIATTSNSKYPSLTETILAEHDRIHGTTPPYHTTKRDNLIKWTQELASFDRLSPPFPENEIPLESFHGASSSISSTTTTTNDLIQSNRGGIISSQNNSNSNQSQSTSAATNNGGSIIGGAGSTSTTVAGTSTATTGGTTSNNTHSKSTSKATPLPPPPPLLKQPTNTSTTSTNFAQKNRSSTKGSNAVAGRILIKISIKKLNFIIDN